MPKMNPIDYIAIILLIIGGLNWGLIGILNFNLVEFLTMGNEILAKIIYSIVGISALYSMFRLPILGLKKLMKY